jgi:hypothetical protein
VIALEWIVLAGAVLTALGYLIRLGRRIIRYLTAAHDLLEHELTHNHGSSMKDDTRGTNVIVTALQRDVAYLYRHLGIERLDDDPA